MSIGGRHCQDKKGRAPEEEEDDLCLAELAVEVDGLAVRVAEAEATQERVAVRVELLWRDVRHGAALLDGRPAALVGGSGRGRWGGWRGGDRVKRDLLGLRRGRSRGRRVQGRFEGFRCHGAALNSGLTDASCC